MDNGMIEKSKKIRWKTDEYMKTVEKNGVTYLKYRLSHLRKPSFMDFPLVLVVSARGFMNP